MKHIVNAKQGPVAHMNSAAIPRNATSSVDLSIILKKRGELVVFQTESSNAFSIFGDYNS